MPSAGVFRRCQPMRAASPWTSLATLHLAPAFGVPASNGVVTQINRQRLIGGEGVADAAGTGAHGGSLPPGLLHPVTDDRQPLPGGGRELPADNVRRPSDFHRRCPGHAGDGRRKRKASSVGW